MTDLTFELPATVSDARGTFRACVRARQRADGTWEGWLEFVPADPETAGVWTTAVEVRQDDRARIAQWASGLTHADATRALSAATIPERTTAEPDLLFTLEELVDALDRRRPQIERVGEADILADANRLRACALQRIALLRRRRADPVS